VKKEFFTSVFATVVGGAILSLLFFIVSDFIFRLPSVGGRWVFSTIVNESNLERYKGMQLIYTALLNQEGQKISGTAEKIAEKTNEGTKFYTGKNRVHLEITGYITRKYLSKDQIAIHYIEHGDLRHSSTIHQLKMKKDNSMSGFYDSTVADQSGSVVWTRQSPAVIAIDIGHSKLDPGATSARGIPEFKFNHQLATELSMDLKKERFLLPFLINQKGDMNGKNNLNDRIKIANAKKADLFISIHHDSVQEIYLKEEKTDGQTNYYSDEFSGFSIIYSENNAQKIRSLKFAKILGDELIKNGLKPSLHHAEDIPGERRHLVDAGRGIYNIDFLVVKETKMPAILLEAGIIVNREDELKLESQQYRQRINNSISKAISIFFAGKE
jgi:N-acetylmuramoyl-L-alanine amidase